MLKSLKLKRFIYIALLLCIGSLMFGMLSGNIFRTQNKKLSLDTTSQNVPISKSHLPSLKGEKAIAHLKQTGNHSSLSEAVTKVQHKIVKTKDKLVAANPANNLKAEFDEAGLSLHSTSKAAKWKSRWQLKSIGYGNAQLQVKSGELISKDQRVEIAREEQKLVEWFENRPNGLEHGYTLAKRPVYANSAETLRLVMEVSGDLTPTANHNGQTLILKDNNGKEVLQYRKLKVWDADNKEQVARMQVSDNKIFLDVEEATAKYPLTIDPTFETQKLIPTSGLGNNFRYGTSVAISGDTAVVGASQTGTGRTWVFVKTGTTWTQQQQITASDGTNGDKFGNSVAIEGDTIVVGAWREFISTGGNFADGAAYFFERTNGFWSETQKISAPDACAGAAFGLSLALSGDTVIIGAPGACSSGAYIFVKNSGVWTHQQTVVGLDRVSTDNFGDNVAISGDSAIVGAYLTDVSGVVDQGAAYIFVRSGTTWSEQQKLTASTPSSESGYGFGVAIDGDTAIVGSPRDDIGSNVNQGSAYVYVRNSGSWSEQQKLTALDGDAGDGLGFSVAIDDNQAIAGAYWDDIGTNVDQGSAYIFKRNGGVWSEQNKLIASDGNSSNEFGDSVVISGNLAIVGAPSNFLVTGSAYIFPVIPTFTVTKTDDTNDGTCDSDCSLREAIAAANATSTDDRIDFASPLFDSPQTITLGGTVLTIGNNGKTTIDGPGADLLTISGNNAIRVFFVNSGAEAEINGLTISDGLAPNTYAQYGGALKTTGGNVTLNNVAVSGNSSPSTGGGLSVELNGKLTLNNSTVNGNTSINGGGGGIYSNRSELTLNNSTVSDNSSLFPGGGIVVNSDISGGVVTINNSTITNNTSNDSGGGMISYRASNLVKVANTIIAGNNAPVNPDVSGSFDSLGYNLIGAVGSSSGFGATGDQTGTVALPLDPVLGPLQDNGGTTLTHLLLGGSPAINGGSNALIPTGFTNDQRGAGFVRIFNTTVDTGSVEVTTIDQTITFAALANQTYGDAALIVSATASSGLPVSFAASGDCSVAGSTVTISGAGSCTITASQGGDSTYNAAPDVEQDFIINKATLTITPDNQTITFGDADPAFTFSYSGFVGSDNSGDIGTEPICEVSGTHTDAGSYPISCSGGDDNNYDFTYGTATLTINKADQTITFGALADKTYGDGTFNVSATSTSGLAVSFSAAGNCSIAGTTVTITGAGSCTVTASQLGDDNYNTASDVDQSFMINKAELTVTPDDQQIIFGSPDPAFTFSYAGFVNGENAGVVDTAPTCQVSGPHSMVGSYTISCSGGIDNNYSFTYETANLSVIYNFNGFFNPIDNFDVNLVKAGRGIPVKFSLNGDFGLNIIAAGYPVSYMTPCDGSGDDGDEIPTVTAGNSSLSYDASEDQYNYVWKTDKNWKGTCRTLVVQLNDGTFHTANFKFK